MATGQLYEAGQDDPLPHLVFRAADDDDVALRHPPEYSHEPPITTGGVVTRHRIHVSKSNLHALDAAQSLSIAAGGGAHHVWSRRTNEPRPIFPSDFPLPSAAVTDVVRSEMKLGRELPGRLRDPRRVAAIVVLALSAGVVLAFLIARGQLAGADAF